MLSLIGSSAMADERLMLLKFQENDQTLFAIGHPTRQLTNFLKTAFIQTNLTGLVEWINKTNIYSDYLLVATPDANEPIAKTTKTWSVQEWLSISSSIRRVNTNAANFRPSITPEQAIALARKQVIARNWERFEVNTPLFEKGKWHVMIWRLPAEPGGHADIEISPDGEIQYIPGL